MNSKPLYRTANSRRRLPENHPYDVVLCYDSTGSMGDFINSVKASSAVMVRRIFDGIRGVKIGVSAT